MCSVLFCYVLINKKSDRRSGTGESACMPECMQHAWGFCSLHGNFGARSEHHDKLN